MARKEKTLATEIIKGLKIKNFILTILLICSIGYNIYLTHDIGYEEITETYEYTQDIDDVGDISNSNIVNGGDING